MKTNRHCIWFNEVTMKDVASVGGKVASLGEMIGQLEKVGIRVPAGFATTADAFNEFIHENKLEEKIQKEIRKIDVDNITELQSVGSKIRQWILQGTFTQEFNTEIVKYYQEMAAQTAELSVAVRSSATAEDLPDASFAGQQETYLNVKNIKDVLEKIKLVYASLYTDRAISYRVHHNFNNDDLSIAVGIQKMVRSDLAASGVAFTLDTESGYGGVIYITSSYGLGEAVVSGAVNPDEFYVSKLILQKNKNGIIRKLLGSKEIKIIYSDTLDGGIQTNAVDANARNKFSITDSDIIELAKFAISIENHYRVPMDIEWAKDGKDGLIYVLQARPETVRSKLKEQVNVERYELLSKGKILTKGRSIGSQIISGKACIVKHIEEMSSFQQGDILVADMTNPDWEPIMKRAGAIVTNRGGRTCHAAIISRELGIPAIVGCGNATQVLNPGDSITVSCENGEEGIVYEGILSFQKYQNSISNIPKSPVKLMLNIGNPERAFACYHLPVAGVGLARLEFIISNSIGIHPRAIFEFDRLPKEVQKQIESKTSCYVTLSQYYTSKLAEGISTIASVFYPKPVIVRLSDFKSNEYAKLLGGTFFEPKEDNPMIGYRGVSRYVSEEFKKCFELECEAILKVRNEKGLDNVQVMIPFVRTLGEAKKVTELLNEFGIRRNENGLKIIMMCEVPSNAILAKEFLKYFDGFSVGSNDLTQLTLGIDRDSASISYLFDERDDAVKALLGSVIKICKEEKKYIGICGQGPSDYPDFAKWLLQQGIESISLNPDAVINTALILAAAIDQ